MKILFFTLSLSLFLSSCLRLDGNLFNPNVTPIEAYTFDGFPNPNEQWGPQYDIAEEKIELFSLNSDPGGENVKIYAVYVGDPARIASDTVILYCHGNRDHMDYYWQRTKLLANLGGKHRYGVMTLDYRGYGLSEGSPSEEGLYQDVDAAMRWLKERGLTNDRLIIYGFSMGSAPSCRLTAQPRSMQPSKVILEAPFASAEVMVQDAARLALPGIFFTDLKIDNAEQVKNIEEPLLWIHGIDDDFLSIETHGEVVARNHSGQTTELRIPAAGHGNIPTVMSPENYISELLKFIER